MPKRPRKPRASKYIPASDPAEPPKEKALFYNSDTKRFSKIVSSTQDPIVNSFSGTIGTQKVSEPATVEAINYTTAPDVVIADPITQQEPQLQSLFHNTPEQLIPQIQPEIRPPATGQLVVVVGFFFNPKICNSY